MTPLQEALGRHMNVAEAEKSSGNPNWWKIQEACMVAVHVFRDMILESEEKFELLNYLTLVRNWLNHQECPHLVGRALWTLSTYSKSKLYNPQMLDEILNATLQSLHTEKAMVLRISAVRYVLSRKIMFLVFKCNLYLIAELFTVSCRPTINPMVKNVL